MKLLPEQTPNYSTTTSIGTSLHLSQDLNNDQGNANMDTTLKEHCHAWPTEKSPQLYFPHIWTWMVFFSFVRGGCLLCLGLGILTARKRNPI